MPSLLHSLCSRTSWRAEPNVQARRLSSRLYHLRPRRRRALSHLTPRRLLLLVRRPSALALASASALGQAPPLPLPQGTRCPARICRPNPSVPERPVPPLPVLGRSDGWQLRRRLCATPSVYWIPHLREPRVRSCRSRRNRWTSTRSMTGPARSCGWSRHRHYRISNRPRACRPTMLLDRSRRDIFTNSRVHVAVTPVDLCITIVHE